MAGQHFVFPFFATIFLAIFSLNLFAVQNWVGAIRPQDKMKNFTKRYLTQFLTDDQQYNLSKTIAVGMYNGLTQSELYYDIYGSLMATLTPAQVNEGVQYAMCFFMNGFSSPAAVLQAAGPMTTVIGNRLRAVYNETMVKINSMKAVPRGVNAVYQQVYRIGAQFETQSNICILNFDDWGQKCDVHHQLGHIPKMYGHRVSIHELWILAPLNHFICQMAFLSNFLL